MSCFKEDILMRIDVIKVGGLECNCYLLEKDNQYLLVDPGEDLNKILHFIHGKDILGILITHYHYDHVGSLKYLQDHFHYSVYDFFHLEEGVKIIGPFVMEVIFTPGHSKDMVSYYFREDKVMITGDFLFKGTIGRCDLDGGNFSFMYDSIQKIKQYDDDIVIYPGHGESSTLGEEKKYNPYFG